MRGTFGYLELCMNWKLSSLLLGKSHLNMCLRSKKCSVWFVDSESPYQSLKLQSDQLLLVTVGQPKSLGTKGLAQSASRCQLNYLAPGKE